MGILDLQWDAKARRTICLAKAIANRDGETCLDAVHVVKAAVLAFPEGAALLRCESSEKAAVALAQDYASLLGGATMEQPMALSQALSRILRRFAHAHRTVTLDTLIAGILRASNIRVTCFLKTLAAKPAGTRQRNRHEGGQSGYSSRRDWLNDLRTEWILRKVAARQACDGHGGLEQDGWDKPYSAEHCLDSLVRVAAANRSRAAMSPARYDPLAPLTRKLDEIERGVCEGVLVHQLYELSDSFFAGVPVRSLAQMLGPEIYPANVRRILEAVDQLTTQGLLTRSGWCDQDRLSDRVVLAEYPLDQLLTELANDAISAGELNWMKRRLRREGV